MFFILILVFLALGEHAFCQGNDSSKTVLEVFAARTSEVITIDGYLSEEIWNDAPAVSGFIQRDPDEGKLSTQNTVVKVVYDESALYVGAALYDTAPDSISARLSRRDVFANSDLFFVFLDPFFDKRTGFYFGMNAAGTLYDGVLFNDSWDDDSWDGVWEGKISRNENGWFAEFRIPFSQLKFNSSENMTWGINFSRDIIRRNERSNLIYVPKTESGFVSRFALLTGLSDIKAARQIEILPYFTTKAEYLYHDTNDPLNNNSKYIPGLGADFKTSIGTNLTLNATINPDFGQVEIDPAVINLSDVESFFSEKRPFFIEGSTIFDFGVGGANNYWGFNWSNPDFFYSRRIGRVPQGRTPDADYVDYPSATHIIGAAKLTGKLGDSWNIGTIQAVTSREYAATFSNGSRSSFEVEPLSYYGVARVQKEFNEGTQALGFISTLTYRDLRNERLKNEFNNNAFTGGLDGWTFLDSSKSWVLTGWMGMSHVSAEQSKLISLQRSSIHYFQRPDAKNLGVDSSATSLTGYAGRFYVNKQKGNVFFNTAFGFVSPKFNTNDIGFIWRTDLINAHAGGGYRWTDPTDWFRYAELGIAAFRNYDFDGNILWHGVFQFGFIRFLNYYTVNWNMAYNPPSVNNRRTRGGPLTLNPAGYQTNINVGSDFNKNVAGRVGLYRYQSPGFSTNYEIYSTFEFKVSSNLTLSVSPYFSKNKEHAQWVKSVGDAEAVETYGRRYVFANLNQNTFGAGIRLNWTFTPELSLQFYVQPLISAGKYTNYKELKRGSSYDFLVYGEEGSTFDSENNLADPDGDGPIQPINVGNPDFNFRSLRGNAVLRWEYMPGSVFYFVWTQTRADFEDHGEFNFDRAVGRLIDTVPDNIFMVKFTYWFNM